MTEAKDKGGEAAQPKRQHKATYARDKRNGGYLIRVAGPRAGEFAGREVPVVRRDDSETTEKLDGLVWKGMDEELNIPCALYTFVAKPKEELDEIPF